MRWIILIGSGLSASGSILKCFSINPSLWWVSFFGQTLAALANPFLIHIPPRLAAIWFPSNQVSTATSIGVFGNQLGVAIGFIIPPMFVSGPIGIFSQNGSYPSDWSNSEKYPEIAQEQIYRFIFLKTHL